MGTNETVTMLLVEDDEVDAEAIQRAFRKHKLTNRFVIAKDGIEALDYLRGENGKTAISRPYMILLDLNMPRMNGFEFLAELRADANIADSIVFVLSTSDLDEDKATAYDYQVAGYTVKGKVGGSFKELASLINAFWQVVEFPPGHALGN